MVLDRWILELKPRENIDPATIDPLSFLKTIRVQEYHQNYPTNYSGVEIEGQKNGVWKVSATVSRGDLPAMRVSEPRRMQIRLSPGSNADRFFQDVLSVYTLPGSAFEVVGKYRQA